MAVVLKGDQSAERQRVSLIALRRRGGKGATRYKYVGLQARFTFRTADLGGAGNARLHERAFICARLCVRVHTCLREEDV